MAVKKIGAKISLEGEKEYRAAVTAINSGMRTMTSEMKLVESQFKANANSTEALTKKSKILSDQYDSQKQKVAVYETALKKSSEAETRSATRLDNLRTKLQSARDKMSDMEKTSDSTTEELEEQQKVVSRLEADLKKAENGYQNAQTKTARWQTSLNDAERELNNLDSELKQNDRYLDEARRSADGTAKSIDEYGKEVVEAKNETSTFGAVLKANLTGQAIVAGIKTLTRSITTVAGAVTTIGSEFDYSMSKVQALSSATASQMEKLTAVAREFGATTRFTASQAAEGLQYMALAGWDVQAMIDGLPGVINLAAAADMDLATASDILTDSMTALNDKAEESTRYADVLAKTQASSNTTVEMLGEAFANSAATAGAYNFSLEDVSTTLGVMANAGIKGAMAGTNLSTIMTRLATNTNGARDTLEELGVEFFDNNGNARDLGEVIMELCDATADMNDESRAQVTTAIAGKNAQKSLNAILNQGSTAYRDLNEKLENCNGAAAQMSAIMQDNLKGDLAELTSATEELGISVYDKFEGSFRSAVQTATSGVSDLSNSLNRGSLGRSVDNLADSFGDLTEHAVDFAVGAVPVVCDGIAWVIEHGDGILSVLQGMATGFVTLKVVTAVGSAMEAFTVATEGATIAQGLFNAVANANPYMILAAGVGTAVAVLGIFSSKTDTVRSKTQILEEETQALKDSMDSIRESMEEQTSGWEEQQGTFESQSAVAKTLAGELAELTTKNDGTTASKQRMKKIVDQLNSVLPNLAIAIDEETGALSMSNEELLRAVDATLEYNKAKAATEKLTEIAKEMTDAEIELYEAEEQIKEIGAEINALQDERNRIIREGTDSYVEYNGQMMDSQTALMEIETQQQALVSQQEALTENTQTLSATLEETNGTYDAVSEYQQACVEKSGELGVAFEETGTSATEAAEVVQTAMQTQAETISEATTNILENIQSQTNAFDEFSADMDVTSEEMLSNLQSQIEGVANWSANMATLADQGVNQGLLDTLAEMGPQGAGYVQALAAMTEPELEEYNRMWVEKTNVDQAAADNVASFTSEVISALAAQEESISQSSAEMGENIPLGMGEGIRSQVESVKSQIMNLDKAAIDQAKKDLDEHSPSRVFREIGSYISQGLATGVKQDSAKPSNEVSAVARKVMEQARSGLQVSSFVSIGSSIVSGMARGIVSGASSVVSAISSVASNAIRVAKNALGIHSPSTVFAEIGKYTAEGFGIGYEKEMSNVNAAIAESVAVPNIGSLTGSYESGTSDLEYMLRAYLPFLAEIAAKDTTLYPNRNAYESEITNIAGRGIYASSRSRR